LKSAANSSNFAKLPRFINTSKTLLTFFPDLPDRTNFVRQSTNLWQVKLLVQIILTERSEQRFDPVQSIDTVPLPVCTYTRSGFRDKRFPSIAEFSHCAAKKMHYYGFKLGLRLSHTLGGFINLKNANKALQLSLPDEVI
jgi:hypothetical protein